MDFEFSFKLFPKIAKIVLPYLRVTFSATIIAFFAGTVLAAALVKFRLSKKKLLNSIAALYVWSIRCTPTIILIFIVFYGLPFLTQLIGINILGISRIFFLIISLSIMFSATFSEVMRSAYLSINKGQREAAISIGLSESQAFFRIVFPQALKVALPNIGNSVIFLFKDTSLAYTIGVIDLMGKGNNYITQHYGIHALEVYLTVGSIYWLIVICFEKTFSFLDKKVSKGAL